MLDLQAMTSSKKLYEIKMFDGQVLTLKMPSQGLFQKIMALQNAKNSDVFEVMDTVYDIIVDILNLNTQKVVYKKEDIQNDLDLPTAMYVIQDYITSTTKTLGE